MIDPPGYETWHNYFTESWSLIDRFDRLWVVSFRDTTNPYTGVPLLYRHLFRVTEHRISGEACLHPVQEDWARARRRFDLVPSRWMEDLL